MAAPIMQLRIFHRSFSRTAKDCTRTGKNLRNFRKLGKSLAVLGGLELSCQGLGILELSWQGLKSTGVSVRVCTCNQKVVFHACINGLVSNEHGVCVFFFQFGQFGEKLASS